MNIPEVLRRAANELENSAHNPLTNTSLQPVELGRWRTLTIGYLVRDGNELFIDYITDVLANGANTVVGLDGQESGQEIL